MKLWGRWKRRIVIWVRRWFRPKLNLLEVEQTPAASTPTASTAMTVLDDPPQGSETPQQRLDRLRTRALNGGPLVSPDAYRGMSFRACLADVRRGLVAGMALTPRRDVNQGPVGDLHVEALLWLEAKKIHVVYLDDGGQGLELYELDRTKAPRVAFTFDAGSVEKVSVSFEDQLRDRVSKLYGDQLVRESSGPVHLEDLGEGLITDQGFAPDTQELCFRVKFRMDGRDYNSQQTIRFSASDAEQMKALGAPQRAFINALSGGIADSLTRYILSKTGVKTAQEASAETEEKTL